MKRFAFVLGAAGLFVAAIAAQQPGAPAPQQPATPPLIQAPPGAAQEPFPPVTDEMLWKPSPSDWLSWRRTLDGHGFSPLDQVNRNNVRQLRMVWTRAMGAGNQESTPLAYNGMLFVPMAGDYIMAINAKTGDVKWEARRRPNGRGNNRNLAIWGTTLIDGSSDNFMYAIDARTGQPVWQTSILDPKTPASMSSGPIIANGKVISGRQCQPAAGNDACIVVAHDAKTGKELWRTRTIPLPGEFGYDTWGDVPMNERWHVGTWMVPSYDPQTNLIIVGTSVTIPAPKFLIGGNDKEHLYHNSTLAIDADSGKIKWYYQHVVDHWDLDHPFERILVDVAVAPDASEVPWINPRIVNGERRKVVTGIPGKTGIIYTLDRQTGEFLWARPTNFQNVISSIDGATGAVTVNPAALFTRASDEHLICPNTNGGKNWPPGAFSPLNNAMFMPVQNTCAVESPEADAIPPAGAPSGYMLRSRDHQIAPGAKDVGTIHAVSVETGKTLWTFNSRAGVLPLMATGGGLLFGGDVNGNFRVFDQNTGKVLWETNLGSAVNGFPMTYTADGKQYVVVSTGASVVSAGISRLAPELKQGAANRLYAFALP